MDFISKLKKIESDYDEYMTFLNSNEVIIDSKLYSHYFHLKSQIEEIALKFKQYNKILSEFNQNMEALKVEKDAEIKQLLQTQNLELEKSASELETTLKKLLLDSEKLKNEKVIIEITAKSNFPMHEILWQMIENFLKKNNFSYTIKTSNLKTVIFLEGTGCFEKFKIFNGQVKIINLGKENFWTVAVLNDESDDIVFNEKDVDVQTLKSGGAGGQHINKTESAVRLIHTPTKISVECQDERSQTLNKSKAIELLKQKIEQKNTENREKLLKNQRKLIKNALFSNTSSVIFDTDKNEIVAGNKRIHLALTKIIEGNLDLLFSEIE